MTEAAVLTRMLHAIDALDFATLRSSFADSVRTDYTSLWGGEPETVDADELVAGWRQLMLGLDATQHLTGPIVTVDGRLHTHVVAHHWRGGAAWTVYGHYIATVAGGKITELILETLQQEGNREIPALAREQPVRSGG